MKKETLPNAILSNVQFIPENLSWKLYIKEESFKFIGSINTFGDYAYLKNITYLRFLRLTKECFRQVQQDVIRWLLYYGNHHKGIVYCDLLLPMKINESYMLVKQTICKLKLDKEVHGLLFVNVPVKQYDDEPIDIQVGVNYKNSKSLMNEVYDFIHHPNIFSKQQLQNVRYIHQNLTSDEIAVCQDKTKAAIYKLNRKILEILSNFFDIEFKSANEAVEFYYKCFPKADFR